jgi:hypothetical protein
MKATSCSCTGSGKLKKCGNNKIKSSITDFSFSISWISPQVSPSEIQCLDKFFTYKYKAFHTHKTQKKTQQKSYTQVWIANPNFFSHKPPASTTTVIISQKRNNERKVRREKRNRAEQNQKRNSPAGITALQRLEGEWFKERARVQALVQTFPPFFPLFLLLLWLGFRFKPRIAVYTSPWPAICTPNYLIFFYFLLFILSI